jgi:hypothetical protein
VRNPRLELQNKLALLGSRNLTFLPGRMCSHDMGNSKVPLPMSKQNNEGVHPPHKCSICLDQGSNGLHCENGHTICRNCLTPYIETTSQDAGKLKDGLYVIECPEPDCDSRPYNVAELIQHGGSAHSVNSYVSTLVEICKHKENNSAKETESKRQMVPHLLDALNLKCPNRSCRAVLDPTPDGCSAVRCAACATYACFLCFMACDNSSSCHRHVRECVHSPSPQNLFISELLRQPVHKRIRVIQLRKVLSKALLRDCGPWASGLPHDAAGNTQSNEQGKLLRTKAKARRYLETIAPNLIDVGITPEDVFSLDVRPASGGRTGDRGGGDGDRAVVAQPGPLLQPAIGRYVEWWEVGLIFLVGVLFLVTMVYVIFLLASVADMRKEERWAEQYPRPSTSDRKGYWEQSEWSGMNLVEKLVEGLYVEEPVVELTREEMMYWTTVQHVLLFMGTSVVYAVVVASLMCLCLKMGC